MNKKSNNLFSTKDLEQIQNRIGRKYWFYKGDELYRYRLGQSNGPYQTRNLQMLRLCQPDARTIIDIGSNIGTNTIEYATWAKNVESFEPMRNNLYLCKKNVSLAKKQKLKGTYYDRKTSSYTHNPNKPDGWWKEGSSYASLDLIADINFYNVALGPKKDKVRMEQKLSEFSRGDAVSVNKKSKHPRTNVNMETLDSYKFKNVDIIKIDVEGYELEVLKGSKKTIKKHQPVIQVELRQTHTQRYNYGPNDLVDFVMNLGDYILCNFNGIELTEKDINKPNSVMDVFFVPRNISYRLSLIANKPRIHKGMNSFKNTFAELFE